jgi:crotonobetainyl-CoA:carnitine CoA-transferase CaiB-like acyl-CoA transferase
LHDPHVGSRGVIHHHDGAPGVEGPFAVPLAAFRFAHGGPRIDSPPPLMGANTEAVLGELGYGSDELAELRAGRVI